MLCHSPSSQISNCRLALKSVQTQFSIPESASALHRRDTRYLLQYDPFKPTRTVFYITEYGLVEILWNTTKRTLNGRKLAQRHPLLLPHGYWTAGTKGDDKVCGIRSSGAADVEEAPTPCACSTVFLSCWNTGLQEENMEAKWQMIEIWLLQDTKLGHYGTLKALFSLCWFASLPALGLLWAISIFILKKRTSSIADKIQGHCSRQPYTTDFLASLHSALLQWQVLKFLELIFRPVLVE